MAGDLQGAFWNVQLFQQFADKFAASAAFLPQNQVLGLQNLLYGKAVVLKLLEIVVFLCDKHHLVLVEGFKAEPVIFADHANQTQVKAAFQNFVQNALAVTLMDIEIGFRTQLFVGRKKLRQQIGGRNRGGAHVDHVPAFVKLP